MRLSLLDYGRFFAALFVVIFHYFYSGIANGKVVSIDYMWFSNIASYGHFGVQFFFIISGYVIFYSLKDKNSALFLKSRLKRLYPTYWSAIIFTSFFALTWGASSEMSVTILQIFVNFTMLQQFLGVNNIDGVYWTLFYELIFYGIVFLTLFFGNFKKLLWILILWPFMIVFMNFIVGKNLVIFNMYFLYFIIGAMFALLKNQYISKNISLVVLIFCCFFSFFQMYQAGIEKNNNIIIVFIIHLAMIYFFYFLNSEKSSKVDLPFANQVGGMTYPLYLIHAHFGYMFLNKFASNENKSIVYSLLILGVIFISWVMWYVIENKQKKFWDKLFNYLIIPVLKLQNIRDKKLNL